MTKKARDLTNDEQDLFGRLFYEAVDLNDADGDNGCPWGCPWYFGSTVYLEGGNIQEMVENYILKYKDDWEEQERLAKEDDD